MTEGDSSVERLNRIPPERRAEFLRLLGLDDSGQATSADSQQLTDEQEQVWVATRMLGENPEVWTTSRYRIVGPLQQDVLASAIRGIYLTADALHATFRELDGTASELSSPNEAFEVSVVDASNVSADEQHSFLDRASAMLKHDLPRLEAGPLVRPSLIAFSPNEHVLLWAAHPLVFDNRSAHVFVDRLADAYAAAREGTSGPTIEGYGAYRRWQLDWCGSIEAEAHLNAWRNTLDGMRLTELPYHQQPAHAALRLSETRDQLEAARLRAVRAYCDQRRVEPEAVVVAAYAATLSRHTAQTDLVVGVPHDFEVSALDQQTLGLLGNLLPLRLSLSGRPSFDELVRQTQAAAEEARRRLVPYKRLLDSFDVPRDPGGLPLLTTGIALASPPRVRETAGVSFALEHAPLRGNRFRLGVEVSLAEPNGELLATWDGSCLREQAVRRLLNRFVSVLEEGCTNGSCRVNGLQLLPEGERTRTIQEWNDTTRSRTPATIHSQVASASRDYPHRTAVVAGSTAITYAELDNAVQRLAAALAAHGVKSEDHVGLAVGRNANAVIATLGILAAGAAFVPVDCDQPSSRVQTILEDVNASIVVSDDCHAGKVPPGPWTTIEVESLLDGTEVSHAPQRLPACAPENTAYVMYTSGSTGEPKGVAIEHRNVVNFAQTVKEMFHITPDDRIVHFASATFDVSIFELFAALTTGAELHVAAQDERRSLDRLTLLLTEHEITICDLPPAIMELLDPTRFPSLRVAFVGGEAFTGELTTRWARGRRFFNGYGPTETTVTVVAKECTGEWSTSPPIGRAMANHRAYVLNDELEPQPTGVVGDLYIAGSGLARGYVGRPDTTATAFLPDPFSHVPGERMYRTGDLAYWNDEGDLVFSGRNDRQIKLRGIRIELGDIEAALERHPQVRQAVVLSTTTTGGSQETSLVAYVVSRVGTPINVTAMREFLLEELPEFMVPAQFVHVERLALTGSGKVDTSALPRPAASTGSAPHGTGPRTPTERRVAAEIFGPLLGVDTIDVNANLFALGGSSLQAIQVVARVRSAYGVDIPLDEFFSQPTVARVAAAIDGLTTVQERP